MVNRPRNLAKSFVPECRRAYGNTIKSQRISARFGALTILEALIFLHPAVGRAAEIELGDTSMADGLASAFVIARNNDQRRSYAAITVSSPCFSSMLPE
jgi:hypothetical protein